MLSIAEADFTPNPSGLEIAVLKDINVSNLNSNNYIDLTEQQTLLLTDMLIAWKHRWMQDNATKINKMVQYKNNLALLEAE